MPAQQAIRRKLVVIGDGACGKTSLLVAYKDNRFATDYVPTVFENSRAVVAVEERAVDLALWDTAGQEDYDRLRPLSYPDSHVVLVCFAVDKLESLLNVQRKWVHELRQYCPAVPVILVGCKADLRDDGTGTPASASTAASSVESMSRLALDAHRDLVAPALAQSMAERIGAVSYVECSAKTRFNVGKVFAQAARASLACPESDATSSSKNRSQEHVSRRKKRSRCSIV